MRPSSINVPFNSRIGQQPHHCDENVACSGDPWPNESKWNRDGEPVSHVFLFHRPGPFLFLARYSASHFAHVSPPICDLRCFSQQFVRESTLKDIHGEITTPRSAKRAIGDDPRTWHGLNWRRNIVQTCFANYDKGMDSGCRAIGHGDSIDEYKAKISPNSI